MENHKYSFQKGFGLIELLIAVGIMAIIATGMASMLTSQQRETKALSEALAKLDLEKLLIATLADGKICNAELAPSAFNGNVAKTINASNPTAAKNSVINLSSIHASDAPTAPILIDKITPASPMANTLMINNIQFTNFVSTGNPNEFSTDLVISFLGTIRALKPIILKTTVTVNSLTPTTQVIACSSSSSSAVLSGSTCGMKDTYGMFALRLCNGFNPRVGCPSGYTQGVLFGSNSDNWGYTCYKN